MQGLAVQKYVQLDKLSKGFGKGYELFHGKSFRTDGGRRDDRTIIAAKIFLRDENGK